MTIWNRSEDIRDVYSRFDKIASVYSRGELVHGAYIPPPPRPSFALVSTGGQYINTGVFPDATTRVQARVMRTGAVGATGANAEGFLFGSRLTTTSTNRFTCSLTASGQTTPNAIGSQWGNTTYPSPANTFNSLGVDVTLEHSGAGTLKDGAKIHDFSSATWANTTNIELPLFGLRTGAAMDARYFIGRMYSCKIWNGSTLVRDFEPVPQGDTFYSPIPAPSHCLWDKVTGTYFTNRGTGNFNIIEY